MQHRQATTRSPAALLHLLAVIASITNDAEDVQEAFPRALEEICRFAAWPVGQAYIVAGDTVASHHLWHVDDASRFATFRARLEADGGGDLIARVLATGEAVWVEDLVSDAALADAPHAAAGLSSAIGVPIRVRDEVVAVLGFYTPEQAAPDTDLLELLQTVGVQLVRMIERARTIELMQTEQARQRLLFEASSDAVFITDASARITEANAAACRLLGCTADDLIGVKPADFAAPEWVDVVRHNIDLKLRGTQPATRYEYVVQDFTGRRIPVEVTSTTVCDGDKVVGLHALIRDLRESRRVERALRESEERFRGAFDAAAIGMALASPEGRWLRVNDALCELLGYQPDELLTLRLQDVTHPDDLLVDVALRERLLGGELNSFQMDKRYLRKDGSTTWIHLSVSLVRGDDGAPAYSVHQMVDIDERKRRELEEEELRARHPRAGSLSPREREVLGLLAQGKTSAEVGVELGVAEETVQTHVRRSMAKLDARSRTQAVASAIRLGWLGDDHLAAT